jgi:hypothetical protein
MFFAAGLLIYALIRKNEILKRTAAIFIVICSLLILPVYFTGEEAEHLVEDTIEGVSHEVIHEHEEAAEVSLVGMLILGVCSLLLLLIKKPLPWGWIGLAIGSLVVLAMLLDTGKHGAMIRHTEVYPPTLESQEVDLNLNED